MTPNTPADVASLPAEWRESAAKLDKGFGPGNAIVACERRARADELEAALTTAREDGLPKLPEAGYQRGLMADHPDLFTADQMFAIRDAGIAYGRRLATTEQPGSSVQGEAVECVICGGDGADPEVAVELRCCGRADPSGDCCGNPEPEPVPQPCRQCGGSGKVIPVAQVFTTPPPAPAAEQGDALAAFTDYFVRNYPGPDTVIMDPRWHASRIFRAAQYAISAATQPEARGVERICKGTNCSASKENGHRHSSECLFDHARAVASGVESFALGVTLNDDISYVDWRGQRIDLAAASAAAQTSVPGVFSQMSIGDDPVFPTTEKSP